MRPVLLGWLCAAIAGCSAAQSAGVVSNQSGAAALPAMDYERADRWLCRPDLPTDACRGDLDATELRADGSRVVVPFVPAVDPVADCFYVYPTVDMGLVVGNHTDFSDTGRMRELVRAQAARFGAACRVFAPLYRQATLASFVASPEDREPRLRVAFADVLDAFRWYLAHVDTGRKIVLIGHSQGAMMVTRLVSALFDHDAAMRARLLVALPIGGNMEVAEGSLVGGTLENIPVCASVDQLGCVVTFNTFRPEGVARPWPGPPGAGHSRVCVNPGDIGGTGKQRLTGAVFLTHSRYYDAMPGGDWARTPFIVVPDFYEAWCVEGRSGFRYLAVAEAPTSGDARKSPIDLDRSLWRSMLGLHLLDLQFAQGDLVRLVARKASLVAGATGKVAR